MSLLLALAAQAAAAPPPAEIAEEIVVIGDKLKTWRGTFGKRKGVFTCKTTKSSGDASIDAIRCEAMRRCAMQIDGEAQAIAAGPESALHRKRKLDAMAQGLIPCIKQREDAAIDLLARARAGT